MRAFIEIHLFGALREIGINKNKAFFHFELNNSMPLMEVADCLNISKDLIQKAMVNHFPKGVPIVCGLERFSVYHLKIMQHQ